MKIAFWENQLTLRGTTVACFDYALGNKNILGNQSIIIYDTTKPFNDEAVIQKFKAEFEVFGVTHFSQVDEILLRESCDMLYVIEGGDRYDLVSRVCKTVNHCVFSCDHKHGDIYAGIAPWVKGNDGKYPFVPHMVWLPDINGDLRIELGIPDTATVFGRHGGYGEFSIGYVKPIVYQVALANPNIYFLFVNTEPFCASLPNIIHLPPIVDLQRKVRFINTCDAMLHARSDGEVFSCSMGEFAVRNKPIFTTRAGRDLGNVYLMGDTAFWYSESTLRDMLVRFDKTVEREKDWNTYKDYTPEKVMGIFKQVFIDGKPPLRVYVNGFWSGFIERNNGVHFGVFEHVLSRAFSRDVVFTSSMDEAEVLLESRFAPSVLNKKQWTYSIFFSGEGGLPHPDNISEYSVTMGERGRIKFPLYLLYDFCRPFTYPDHIDTIPPKKVCALITNGGGSNRRFREQFIDELSNRGIRVDMGGVYKNNIGYVVPGTYDENPTLDFQRQYRVVLAMENTKQGGYITEKIVNPIRAGTVPIYYGTDEVVEYIHPERFVRIDPDDIDAAVASIRRLCEDDAYWLSMVNHPPFVRSQSDCIDEVVEQTRTILLGTDYAVEVIGSYTHEPEREASLRPITDYYHVTPSVASYGKEALGHPLYAMFNTQKKTTNEISLAINHLVLFEKYVNTNQYLVVFESDAIPLFPMDVIDSEIRKDIQTMREKHIDFAFIGLGCFEELRASDKKPNKKISNTLWIPPFDPFTYGPNVNGASRCTESYIASPIGIRSFLEWFRARVNHDAIDWGFNYYFRDNPTRRGCWRSPELFKQGSVSGLYPSSLRQSSAPLPFPV
jgi:hypothetical protein